LAKLIIYIRSKADSHLWSSLPYMCVALFVFDRFNALYDLDVFHELNIFMMIRSDWSQGPTHQLKTEPQTLCDSRTYRWRFRR